MRRIFWAVALAAIAVVAPPESPAQGSASLGGTVADSSGGVLPRARVTLTNLDTDTERSTETNDAGVYAIPGLPAGRYVLRASFADFKTAASSEITLNIGQERRVDLTLEPGDIRDTVTVEASAAAASTESGSASTVIANEEVAELPLNGRQLQNLALLAPGVAAGWNWSTAANRYGKARENLEGAFVVNGARGRSNDFVFDGMPMNVRQYGVMNFEPSNEAVQEFEIKTSAPSAEFGRTMGSTVNIVTRAGGQQMHGSVYEFFRNDKLDANDTFNNRAGLERGKLRQNQFGGSIGGPIVKNKHFFFFNTEIARILEGVETRVISVPTLAEKQGLVEFRDLEGNPQTLDLSNQINPISRRLLEFFPDPNRPTGAGGLNRNASLLIALNDYQTHARTDHHLSDRDVVTVRFSWNLNDQNYLLNRFGGPFIPGFNLLNPEETWNGSIGYLRTFSPSAVNEFRVGLNRYTNDLGNGDPTLASEVGLPNGNETANGIPFITFVGGTLESLGGQPWLNREQNELTTMVSNSLSWLKGRHNLKFGGEIRRLQYNTRGASNQRGTISFDGSRNGLIPRLPGNERAGALADFLLGEPFQSTIVTGDFGRGFRQWAYSAYVQDTWRATSRLTVNLGLRYEYTEPWTEVNNKLSNLTPAGELAVVGSPGLASLYRADRDNFGPRLGLAYDVGGDGKTVIRAGFGVLYETLLQANSIEQIENNPPFSASAVTRQPAAFPSGGAAGTLLDLRSAATPSRAIGAIDVNGFRNPYTLQYNFSIQRMLGRNWLAEVSYNGTRGASLPVFRNLNQVPLGALTADQRDVISSEIAAGRDTSSTIAVFRPFPEFDSINFSQNTAQSTFHSGQAKIEKRFGAGPTLLASYTYAKSIDNASDFGSGDASEQVLNASSLAAQRGPSSFDVQHRFSGAFSYELPFERWWRSGPRRLVEGWQVNGIVTLQTGQPFTPFLSVFDPFRNESFNRPNVISNPNADVPDGLAFNPAAFEAPAPGTFGNAGRNIIRGDGFQSFDLSIFKRTSISERVAIELRGEFINAFNHVNFQGPDVNLTSSPGSFIAASQPRVIQIGAKLTF